MDEKTSEQEARLIADHLTDLVLRIKMDQTKNDIQTRLLVELTATAITIAEQKSGNFTYDNLIKTTIERSDDDSVSIAVKAGTLFIGRGVLYGVGLAGSAFTGGLSASIAPFASKVLFAETMPFAWSGVKLGWGITGEQVQRLSHRKYYNGDQTEGSSDEHWDRVVNGREPEDTREPDPESPPARTPLVRAFLARTQRLFVGFIEYFAQHEESEPVASRAVGDKKIMDEEDLPLPDPQPAPMPNPESTDLDAQFSFPPDAPPTPLDTYELTTARADLKRALMKKGLALGVLLSIDLAKSALIWFSEMSPAGKYAVDLGTDIGVTLVAGALMKKLDMDISLGTQFTLKALERGWQSRVSDTKAIFVGALVPIVSTMTAYQIYDLFKTNQDYQVVRRELRKRGINIPSGKQTIPDTLHPQDEGDGLTPAQRYNDEILQRTHALSQSQEAKRSTPISYKEVPGTSGPVVQKRVRNDTDSTAQFANPSTLERLRLLEELGEQGNRLVVQELENFPDDEQQRLFMITLEKLVRKWSEESSINSQMSEDKSRLLISEAARVVQEQSAHEARQSSPTSGSIFITGVEVLQDTETPDWLHASTSSSQVSLIPSDVIMPGEAGHDRLEEAPKATRKGTVNSAFQEIVEKASTPVHGKDILTEHINQVVQLLDENPSPLGQLLFLAKREDNQRIKKRMYELLVMAASTKTEVLHYVVKNDEEFLESLIPLVTEITDSFFIPNLLNYQDIRKDSCLIGLRVVLNSNIEDDYRKNKQYEYLAVETSKYPNKLGEDYEKIIEEIYILSEAKVMNILLENGYIVSDNAGFFKPTEKESIAIEKFLKVIEAIITKKNAVAEDGSHDSLGGTSSSRLRVNWDLEMPPFPGFEDASFDTGVEKKTEVLPAWVDEVGKKTRILFLQDNRQSGKARRDISSYNYGVSFCEEYLSDEEARKLYSDVIFKEEEGVHELSARRIKKYGKVSSSIENKHGNIYITEILPSNYIVRNTKLSSQEILVRIEFPVGQYNSSRMSTGNHHWSAFVAINKQVFEANRLNFRSNPRLLVNGILTTALANRDNLTPEDFWDTGIKGRYPDCEEAKLSRVDDLIFETPIDLTNSNNQVKEDGKSSGPLSWLFRG